ncbi:MAG: signal peptidase I [Bacteroidetes bacterium]|nr:signal peptidase I [Bacteroidota bacterium]
MNTYILILLTILFLAGLAKLFSKAGEKAWKAFIPFFNVYVWLKIVKRPTWWLVLALIPVVNIVLIIGLTVELLNCFGKRKVYEHVIGAVAGFIYLPYIAFYENVEFQGTIDYTKAKKSTPREWSEAIFFAVIAATIIRSFGLEAFKIPTQSMENTLLRGDFLFVSKFHYGAKTPVTPLSIPFTHQTIPVLEISSYLDWIELPSFRLPGLKDVERRDIIVFNYPYEPYRPVDKKTNYVKRCVGIPGDSLQVKSGYVYINGVKEDFPKNGIPQAGIDATPVYPFEYYQQRKEIIGYLHSNNIWSHSGKDFFTYPHDNWTMLNNGPIWIPKENTKVILDENSYYQYRRIFRYYEDGKVLYLKDLINSYIELSYLKNQEDFTNINRLMAVMGQMQDRLQFNKLPFKLAEIGDGFFVQNGEGNLDKFTNNFNDYEKDYQDFCTNVLPGEIEKIIATIQKINPALIDGGKSINIPKVKEYLSAGKNLFLINDVLSNEYTFKQDYYFAMGDNRGESADSRAWGYVPEDHIVGTPVFIWMSFFNGEFHFDRWFSFVTSKGVSKSYLFHFLIGGVILWLANKMWKNKKSKEKKQ